MTPQDKEFEEWFHGFYGRFSFRSEHFAEDCEASDPSYRRNSMLSWIKEAFSVGYEKGRVSVYAPTPQTPEQVEQGLKETMQEVKKIVDSEPTTLTELIRAWVLDLSTPAEIDELVNRIEKWLPAEQSASGSQNTYVECTVEGYNDALRQIKRKLR